MNTVVTLVDFIVSSKEKLAIVYMCYENFDTVF